MAEIVTGGGGGGGGGKPSLALPFEGRALLFGAAFFLAGARFAATFFRAPLRAFFFATVFLPEDLRGDLRADLRDDLRAGLRAALRLVVFFAEDFLRVDFFAVFLFPPLRAAIGTLLY